MKNDLPEEKKSPKPPEYETSETNQSPFEGFQKDDDDVDFEILDALEHMGHPEDLSEKDREPQEDDTIELTLEDEDLIFDDEAEDEQDFHFDESLRVGLEEELLGEPSSEFRLDAPLEEKGQGEGIESTLEDNDFAFDLHQEDEMHEPEFSFDNELDLGLGDSSSAENLFESEEQHPEQPFELSLSDAEPFDAAGSEDTEEFPGETDAETFSIEEGFADLAEDIETTEEQPMEDVVIASTDQEPAFGEFSEKPVIPVGGDEVIDLGDETDLDQASDFEEGVDSWSQAEETNILETEEQDSEDFMASFGDIDLDLEEEATNFLEDSLTEDSDDVIVQSPSTFDFEEGLDLTIDDEDQEFETPDIMTDTESADEDIPDSQPVPAFEEDWDQEDFEDEEFPVELSEDTEAEEEIEPERDEREFLDLDLQLRDEQMEQFEHMIAEAKTLHSYIETLDTHQNEIKETIYQKLSGEYLARKTSIFRTAEFQTMRAEVEQDLQHMLAKRTEFVTAVDRLNEELEEIKVRHLVGEYTQTTLAEKEETQQQDILLWNEKLEHIEQFITRYQAALDAEQALNPLPQEQKEPLPSPPPSEPEETDETISQEDEEEWMQETSEESLGDFFGEGEEAFTETEELPEEDLLESDFSINSDFEEDVDLDQLSKVAEELDREQAESSEEEQVAEDETPQEQEAMVSCKKCGRQTPASEKFCVHCGAKAQ